MASIISAGTTSATALNMSADTSGVLQLASNNGTVAASIDTSQRVGLGLTSLTEKFEVNGSINASTTSSNNFATGNARAFLDYVPASNTARIGQLNGASGLTTGKLSLFNNGLETVIVDTAGRVFTPYQVAFSAVVNSLSTATANAIIPCNAELFDIGGNYNTSTYTFTAPVAGRYFFGWTVRYNGYQANVYLHPRLNINGGSYAISHQIVSIGTSAGAAYMSMSWAGVVTLNANDSVTLFDASQTGVTLGQYQPDQSGFSGYLLG